MNPVQQSAPTVQGADWVPQQALPPVDPFGWAQAMFVSVPQHSRVVKHDSPTCLPLHFGHVFRFFLHFFFFASLLGPDASMLEAATAIPPAAVLNARRRVRGSMNRVNRLTVEPSIVSPFVWWTP